MNALALLVLGALSGLVLAAEAVAAPETQEQLEVEPYDYSMDLDIHKIIHISEAPDTCDVGPVRMTYEDHRGKHHTVEYLVMGNGCSNS